MVSLQMVFIYPFHRAKLHILALKGQYRHDQQGMESEC